MNNNDYQLGDWVQERGIADRLSPPMYITALHDDHAWLEIDPEQGDPWECEYTDIAPIPIDEDVAAHLNLPRHFYLLHEYDHYRLVGSRGNKDQLSLSVTYIHQIQHVLRMLGQDADCVDRYFKQS